MQHLQAMLTGNKSQTKPKGQSRMDDPVTVGTQGTQKRQGEIHKTHNIKKGLKISKG